MALYPLESRSSPIMSTEITCQCRSGTLLGISFPTFCVGKVFVRCRRDISLVSNPPIGTSFGPWNISQSLPVKGATTNTFLFGFTEILLSKSPPNLDALIPLNRAKSYDPNDPTFTFIPILEGEIRNLPVLYLHTFAG